LEAGRYEDAIKNLSDARKEFSILEDYALFYMSDAYHMRGEHDKALGSLRALIKKYPLSPLGKKARINEIREAKENPKEDLLRLYEAYVSDYPDDDETGLMYALYLKENGKKDKATALSKRIYLKAGASSSEAYSELNPSDIRSTDLVERASNLIKKYEFEEAERDLRKAMSLDSGRNREVILKNLGYSLFKQRKYREAAATYDKINDAYFKARSLYRAGDAEKFATALKGLVAGNDGRAGYLLGIVASDKRREKDFDNALKIYNDVLKNYPSEKENAMWGIGWTHYVAGEYKKSADMFAHLYASYGDPKYLYWQARSIEAGGDSALPQYDSLMRMKCNFYTVLSFARGKKNFNGSLPISEPYPDVPSAGSQRFERVEALLSLNMHKEAILELIMAAGNKDDVSELTFIISKLQELGEYSRAIGLASKIPYSEKLHRFWYPLAYWNIVEQSSREHNIDPLLTLSLIREESRYDAETRSPAGARGLMQLLPETAYTLDKKLNIGINDPSQLYNVRNNIHLGTYYLKSLFSEFNNSLPHVIAAYNAGEAAVRKWEQRGKYKSVDEFIEDIPYDETRNYVKRVITSYFQYKKFSLSGDEGKSLDILLGK
jgi:soluble lytic murein transglycosylase